MGYSSLDTTAICTLVVENGSVKDFALVPHEDSDPEALIPRGVRAGARLLRSFADGDDLRIVTPSVRDTDALRQAIVNAEYSADTVTLVDTPPQTPSALARWFLDGNHRGALINDIEEPLTLYTDASVQEGEKHTGGVYAIDATNHIAFFGNRTFAAVESVSEAELQAGLAGLLTASATGVEQVVWVSDNHDAQNMVRNEQVLSQEALGVVSYCTRDFSDLTITDIKGSANILADALAADARHESIAPDMLYTAPPLESSATHLTSTYFQSWPYHNDGQ